MTRAGLKSTQTETRMCAWMCTVFFCFCCSVFALPLSHLSLSSFSSSSHLLFVLYHFSTRVSRYPLLLPLARCRLSLELAQLLALSRDGVEQLRRLFHLSPLPLAVFNRVLAAECFDAV